MYEAKGAPDLELTGLKTIEGIILTNEGEPVEGLFVASTTSNGYVDRTQTNADGFYRLRGQATSSLFLTTTYGGPEFKPIDHDTLRDLELPEFNLVLESAFVSNRRLDIDLPKAVRIRSTVRDSNGNVVAGAMVSTTNGGFERYDSTLNGLSTSGGCSPAPAVTRRNGRARGYCFETRGFSMTASIKWPEGINVANNQSVPDLLGVSLVRLIFTLDALN